MASWVNEKLTTGLSSFCRTSTVLEMAAGTWHAVLSLDTGGIIFEVKHGGYQPVAADDYAHWAPAEGEPGTTELMAWYAQAQVGDSTFAV
ncbi:WbuC family cupin fold metalloprotein [Escherichia coli]